MVENLRLFDFIKICMWAIGGGALSEFDFLLSTHFSAATSYNRRSKEHKSYACVHTHAFKQLKNAFLHIENAGKCLLARHNNTNIYCV